MKRNNDNTYTLSKSEMNLIRIFILESAEKGSLVAKDIYEKLSAIVYDTQFETQSFKYE